MNALGTSFKTVVVSLALIVAPSLMSSPVFSVQSGGISITGQNTSTAANAATTGVAWNITESMTSAGMLSLTDTDGIPLADGVYPYTSGSWIEKVVTNNTGVAWTSFEMELRQIIGTPSGDGDGLSFAQGGGLTFTSNVFSTYTRIDTTRDYLNFSGGTVAPGASVTFMFAVTDNSPQSPVYLLQTPNKVDGSVSVPDAGSSALLVLLGLGSLLAIRRKG